MHEYLEFKDEKSGKFWEITVKNNEVIVQYGKIGHAGQIKTKTFSTADNALLIAEELLKSKLQKGYQKLTKSAETESGETTEKTAAADYYLQKEKHFCRLRLAENTVAENTVIVYFGLLTGLQIVYSMKFPDNAAAKAGLNNQLQPLCDYGYTAGEMPENISGLKEVELGSVIPLPFKSYYEKENQFWEIEFQEYLFIIRKGTIGKPLRGSSTSIRQTPDDARNEAEKLIDRMTRAGFELQSTENMPLTPAQLEFYTEYCEYMLLKPETITFKNPELIKQIPNRVKKEGRPIQYSDLYPVRFNVSSGETDMGLLQYYKFLRRLVMMECKPEYLPLIGKLKYLQYLEIRNCTLNNLSPLAGLRHLEILLLKCQIRDASVLKELKGLKELFIQSPVLDAVMQFDGLEKLTIEEAGITDISALAQLGSLTSLSISNNKLKDLAPLKNLSRLKELALNYCALEDISFVKHLPNLESISLFGNVIQDISSLGICRQIKSISLDKNKITDISPLAALPALQRLSIQENPVSDFSAFYGKAALDIYTATGVMDLMKTSTPKTEPEQVKLRKKVYKVDGVEYAFHYIEPGEYWIGEKKPPTMNVRILSEYWIAGTPVTYKLWSDVYNWGQKHGYIMNGMANSGKRDNRFSKEENLRRPVIDITWRDAIVWCNAFSEMLGLKPVYYSDEKYGILLKEVNSEMKLFLQDGEIDNPFCDWDANGFRLPTFAEWEIAARGGKAGLADGSYNHLYSGSDAYDKVGWFSENSENLSHIVAQKKANALGLFDMSGNVEEWCWDFSDGKYPGEKDDPAGINADLSWEYGFKRICGSGFQTQAKKGLIGYSWFYKNNVFTRSGSLGFRVAQTGDVDAPTIRKERRKRSLPVEYDLYVFAPGNRYYKLKGTDIDLRKIRDKDFVMQERNGNKAVIFMEDNEEKFKIFKQIDPAFEKSMTEISEQGLLDDFDVSCLDVFF